MTWARCVHGSNNLPPCRNCRIAHCPGSSTYHLSRCLKFPSNNFQGGDSRRSRRQSTSHRSSSSWHHCEFSTQWQTCCLCSLVSSSLLHHQNPKIRIWTPKGISGCVF